MILDQVPNRKLSFFDLFRVSCLVLGQRFLAIFAISLTFYVPINVFYSSLPWEENKLLDAFLSFLQIFLTIPVPLAIAILVEGVPIKQQVSYVEALKRSVLKWAGAIRPYLLSFLIIGVGLVVLIIPGIIIMVY